MSLFPLLILFPSMCFCFKILARSGNRLAVYLNFETSIDVTYGMFMNAGFGGEKE